MPASPVSPLQSLLAAYEEETHHFRPDEARDLGLEDYDGLLAPVDAEARRHRLLFLRDTLATLGDHPAGLEARLFHHALRSEIWRLEVERRYERDPLFGLLLIDPSSYLRREERPWERRRQALLAHLRALPVLLRELRDQLDPELPAPVLETAIEAWRGFHRFLREDLPRELVRRSPGRSLRARDGGKGLPAEDLELIAAAARVVKAHRIFLETERLPHATAEFALGREGFEGMLREGEGLPLEIAEVVAAGEKDLRHNRRVFQELCGRIVPGVAPQRAMKELARRSHPGEDPLDLARRTMEELWCFVEERGLVTLPSADLPGVETMPRWMRWAVAALEAPGPFASRTTSARYYITPVDAEGMSSLFQEQGTPLHPSYLQVVTGHEVIPGHHLHALHLRRVESRAQRLFSTTYHFWEGWAHYSEELLAEEGFDDPVFLLMQRKAALERDARLLCSVGLHVEGWSLDEATSFIADRALLDPATARREAVRGTFDPQYLGYTLGKLLLRSLREEMRRFHGSRFDLCDFHDRILSAGAPPISLLREEVFGLRGRRLLL